MTYSGPVNCSLTWTAWAAWKKVTHNGVPDSLGCLLSRCKFQRGHWPCWNSNDPTETNRRFGPTTFLKREYPTKLFHREISPYHILTLTKKKLVNSRLHFRFQRGHWHRWNRFWRLWRRITRRIQSHLRNGFRPWIMALGGVEINRGSKISCNGPFKWIFGPVEPVEISAVWYKCQCLNYT
jgi:hypothetical protein